MEKELIVMKIEMSKLILLAKEINSKRDAIKIKILNITFISYNNILSYIKIVNYVCRKENPSNIIIKN